MTLQVLVLKSDENIIADVSEIHNEAGIVLGYNLSNPRKITISRVKTPEGEIDPTTVSAVFTKWQLFSDDTEYQIPSDWVVTICEPMERIKKSYEENVNAQKRAMSLLTE